MPHLATQKFHGLHIGTRPDGSLPVAAIVADANGIRDSYPPAFTTRGVLYLIEILHQTTTLSQSHPTPMVLYLIEILHQTTTLCRNKFLICSCILSKFYIKPQLSARYWVGFGLLYLIEILHQTTTRSWLTGVTWKLYLIEILHQTTTFDVCGVFHAWLYLIEILHQTTTGQSSALTRNLLYLIEILHQTTTCGGYPSGQ